MQDFAPEEAEMLRTLLTRMRAHMAGTEAAGGQE
jgi:hypothetical protein